MSELGLVTPAGKVVWGEGPSLGNALLFGQFNSYKFSLILIDDCR